jgi:hypothetical protein
MENLATLSLLQWSIVVGILFCLCVVIVMIRNWISQVRDYEYETKQTIDSLTDNESVKALLSQGYIFCFFWKLEDIHAVGQTMGCYLTDQDCVKITAMIKERFNPETGINNDVIRGAILKYCKCNECHSEPVIIEDYGH